MLLVIADTSPIRYLVQVGHIDLLHPPVCSRLNSNRSGVRTWRSFGASSRPGLDQIAPCNHDPALSNLDPGERAAIALGITLKADLVLIDERRGNAAATGKGLEVTGTPAGAAPG